VPLKNPFQKVEEENEGRLQENAIEIMPLPELNSSLEAVVAKPVRNRRRGSISITRFGQLAEESIKGPQGPPIHTLTTIASCSALYRAASNSSSKSYASVASSLLDNENAHAEDHHVTQMLQIFGRQSISKAVGSLLPRRLSRSRSANVVMAQTSMVIGVSVEEATEECNNDAETCQTFIHTNHVPTSNRSKVDSFPVSESWLARTKSLARKFRHRSKALKPGT